MALRSKKKKKKTQLAFFIYSYYEHLLVLDTFVISLTDTSWETCVKGVAAIMGVSLEPPVGAHGAQSRFFPALIMCLDFQVKVEQTPHS